jgi:hypothetical protein
MASSSASDISYVDALMLDGTTLRGLTLLCKLMDCAPSAFSYDARTSSHNKKRLTRHDFIIAAGAKLNETFGKDGTLETLNAQLKRERKRTAKLQEEIDAYEAEEEEEEATHSRQNTTTTTSITTTKTKQQKTKQ